ncbi:MAG: class I SAM-dependent methyltransferase, partial [Betaproteobacteria bacterium]
MNSTLIGTLVRFLQVKAGLLANPQLADSLGISSHLTVEERITLFRLASSRKAVLEIGSYIGASACCFGAALSESGGGRIYCVDTWNNDAMSEGVRDTYGEFAANTAAYSEFIVPIRGRSVDVVDQVRQLAGHLDLLFIDGDHSYEGVKSDWEAYRRLLRPGAIIVMHDWGWAEGVKRVVIEDVMPQVAGFGHLSNMWW